MVLKRTYTRSALSSVLSALLLSAVVIAVGGAIWAFSQGAMTITAEDYAESVINMTDTISERFIIEQVRHDGTNLHIWVYNYGKVDIVVDVYADVDEGESGSSINYEIPSGTLEMAVITLAQSSGKEVAIKVVSRRGNDAYYRFVVPS